MDCKKRRAHAALKTSVICLSAIALAASLGSCGNSRFGSRDPGIAAPATVQAINGEARVDLPGRVSVFLRVVNGNGTPAADLTGSDFNIFENGVLVSQSESFQQIRPQPQVFRSYLHLILDRSNSVQSVGAGAVVDGALQFIEAVTSQQDSNYVKISWFDGSPGLYPIAGHDIGFSNNAVALREAILHLNDEPPFSTSTNLYGAVMNGLTQLDEIDSVASQEGVENRSLTLVTFTDGTHQAGGGITLQDVVSRLEGVSATGGEYNAFTIGVGQEIDANVLVALGPNGSVAAEEFNVLAEAFTSVGEQVRSLANSFYFLSYCSPKTGGMNDLTISVQERPSPGQDVELTFDASYFGAGCAFLDVINHPTLAAGLPESRIMDVAETSDDKVIVVGLRSMGCTEPGCAVGAPGFVARLLTSPAGTNPGAVVDGVLDTTFGVNGVLTLDPGLVSGATSVTVDEATDTIFVAGWAQNTALAEPPQAVIWTVAPDGSSVSRITMPNPGNDPQVITDIVRMSSGVVFAGGFRGETSRSSAVWKLLPSLALDTAFGGDGLVLVPETPAFGNLGVTDLVIGGMDRIYTVGRFANRIRAMALNRTTGAADSSFGTSGIVDVRSNFGGADIGSEPAGAALDGQGRLVIAGTLTEALTPGGVTSQPAVWRILDTGAPDPQFVGSLSSPTYGTGVVTLRQGSTSNPAIDFGRPTRLDSLSIGPDGTILAAGQRMNGAGDTDMAIFAFATNGVSKGGFNFVGFIIDDGASADNSFERGTALHVLDSGAIWTLGTSTPPGMTGLPGPIAIPTVWVDRDPARVFAPIGN